MAICIGISSCVYRKEGSKIECNIVLVVVVRGSGTTYSCCVKGTSAKTMQKQTAIGATCKDPPKENAKTDDMFLLRKCTLAKTMQKQTAIGATCKDHLCCTRCSCNVKGSLKCRSGLSGLRGPFRAHEEFR